MRKENFIQKTDAFIETGSYLGDGIQLAINSGFSEIYSIELGDHLYQHCQRRFQGNPNVNLILGDSSIKLKELLDKHPKTAFTYWLDGHYSSGITVKGEKYTPLAEELEAILSRDIEGELIYIDDMRDYREHVDISLDIILDMVKKYKPNAIVRFESTEWDPEDCMVIEY